MAYTYWLLRFVPDILRGERVNVGVIVGGVDGDDWAMRRVTSLSRARRLGGPDPKYIEPLLERLEGLVARGRVPEQIPGLSGSGPPVTFDRIETIRQHQGNNLQISSPRAVNAATAQAAVDMLFEALVVEPQARGIAGTKAYAVNELRTALRERFSSAAIHSGVNLQTGHQHTRFDFSLGQEQVAQLTQVWSFDMRYPENLMQRLQAASFVTGRLRAKGGLVVSKHREYAVDPNVPVRVLYIPPRLDAQREVFEQAAEAWEDLGIKKWELDRVEDLADEAADLLKAS